MPFCKRKHACATRAIYYFLFNFMMASLLNHASASAESKTPIFVLEEQLGRSWSAELLRVPVPPLSSMALASKYALVDGSGVEYKYQVIDQNATGETIAFVSDLQPFEKKFFWLRVLAKSVATESGALVLETEDAISIVGGSTSLTVSKSLSRDGKWGGHFTAPNSKTIPFERAWQGHHIEQYSTKVRYGGPVVGAVEFSFRFASGAMLKMEISAQERGRGFKVIERWGHWENPASLMTFAMDFREPVLHFRTGSGGGLGRVSNKPAIRAEVFNVVPWLEWWKSPLRGSWVTIYEPCDGCDQALTLVAVDPSDWISEVDWRQGRIVTPLAVQMESGAVTIQYSGMGRNLNYIIALEQKAQAVDLTMLGRPLAPPGQRLRITHSDFPLELVRTSRLKEPDISASRPPILLPRAPEGKDAAKVPFGAPERDRINRLKLSDETLGHFIRYLANSDDPAILERVSRAAVDAMRGAIDELIDQGHLFTFGFAPHHLYNQFYAMHLADWALSDPRLPLADRRFIRSGIMFILQTTGREDYWAPGRGYSANPNMTTTLAGLRGLASCLLNDDPEGVRQFYKIVFELNSQLAAWSDPSGGWREAPQYAVFSLDSMLAVSSCGRNAGYSHSLNKEKLRLVLEWLAKISTPPDPRLSGQRHLPPIGNTYVLQTTSLFRAAADLFASVDGRFSRQMEWMHGQQGKPSRMAVGGRLPAFAPYVEIVGSRGQDSEAPDYQTELFPEAGAVLRNRYASLNEFYAYIIAGQNHDHYDDDSGSISVWAGSVPISDDFGYGNSRLRSDHSMVDLESSGPAHMIIDAFARSENFDFLLGRRGAWRRMVGLSKSPDGESSDCLVVDDEVGGDPSGYWRMWFLADRVKIAAHRVEIYSPYSMITDLYCNGCAPGDYLIETKARRSGSSNIGPIWTSQVGVVIPITKVRRRVTAVLCFRKLGVPSAKVLFSSADNSVEISRGAYSDVIEFGLKPRAKRRRGMLR